MHLASFPGFFTMILGFILSILSCISLIESYLGFPKHLIITWPSSVLLWLYSEVILAAYIAVPSAFDLGFSLCILSRFCYCHFILNSPWRTPRRILAWVPFSIVLYPVFLIFSRTFILLFPILCTHNTGYQPLQEQTVQCTIECSDFEFFFRKWRRTMQIWMLPVNITPVQKRRFSVFWAILCGFSFKVCKKWLKGRW